VFPYEEEVGLREVLEGTVNPDNFDITDTIHKGQVLVMLTGCYCESIADPQPTVTVLIRGPFGRHAWTMQLRHLPRHKSGTKYHAPNPGRPVPMADVGVHHDVKHRYFPENVDRIPQCKV
jgi:hypothetical protein